MPAGPANKYNDRFVARVLSDATDHNDLIAAKRHNVSDRTIRSWRARLETDPVLMAEYTKLRNVAESGWEIQRVRALKAVIEKIQELAAQTTKPEQLKDLIRAAQVLGELQITAESLSVESLHGPHEDSFQSEGIAAGEERDAEGSEGSEDDSAVH